MVIVLLCATQRLVTLVGDAFGLADVYETVPLRRLPSPLRRYTWVPAVLASPMPNLPSVGTTGALQ